MAPGRRPFKLYVRYRFAASPVAAGLIPLPLGGVQDLRVFQGFPGTSPRVGDRERLLGMILRGEYSIVQHALDTELKRVETEMEQLPEGAQRRVQAQWSGRETGPRISTRIESLVALSREMHFEPGESLIDIGSGHGNPAIVLGLLNPKLEIRGYDIAQPKVDGANRLAHRYEVENANFIEQNLMDPAFQLPEADYYYLFNPSYENVIRRVAAQIRDYSRHRRIRVIVYGGSWTPGVFRQMGFQETGTPELRRNEFHIFEFPQESK
jgi:hypothetical protein